MKVVLYLRFSSDKQNEQSIEGQKRICTEYCNRNDMNIVDCYIDRALSAAKNIEKREAFQKMIRDSEKGNFEAVVVYKLDRFARNRYDSATYKNKLKRNGVRVISATENISDNPEGIILESVLEGMAEFYSKELSQKVTRGMHETALKGNSCGGSIPLGYVIKNKKFVIDPVKAEIVVEAFKRYATGETIKEIAADFNARGLRTAKGVPFNKNSFSNMFKNERYIGIYKYKDIRIEGGIPAIIDEVTFNNVQQRMEMNKKAPARAKAKVNYLLSQKLFCGHCGELMTGEYGTSETGEKYYYYTCSGKRRLHNGCDKKAVQKEAIERIVAEEAVKLLEPEIIEMIADAAVRAAEEENNKDGILPELKRELTETKKSISNLLRLVERGSDSEALFSRLDELEKQKHEIDFRISKEETDKIHLDKEQIIWWLSKFANGDFNDETFRRIVLDMLVNSVTIWDEPDGEHKITITYNLTSMKAKTFNVRVWNTTVHQKR
ncbi:MAG: recombinase family protein [Ruminococcaceae bacterium]|nr:recombinase family protein [Oscillospiraceae bacterium]